ncbi:cytochrome P450 6a22-like [Zophobas morio]|uniref:cytochrome P450 6a22-like n=1 Tax=Zophobas morio TaxID=2755281 RepID=UPI003083DB33
MILLNSVFVETVITFSVFLVLVWYAYYRYCFNYWRKRGVPSHPPDFPTGNITEAVLGKENLFNSVENFYHHFKKKGYRHAGLYFFNGPVYLPIDTDIVKAILTTDFEYFVDRGSFIDETEFPLSGHLFSITGMKWKNLRNKLLPTFSTAKLKSMYEIFQKNTESFMECVEQVANKGTDLNIKYAATNFTADIISSTALGIEAGTLKNPDNEISKITFRMFNPPLWLYLKLVLLDGFQNPGNIIKVTHCDRKVEDFFKHLVSKIMNHRENSQLIRKDFMSLLLEIKKKEGLSFEEILSQTFLFFLAGFETSSQTIAFAIHALAHQPDLQDKLRDEIFKNMGKDFRKYSYEEVLKLPYLDKVFNETLRLYPVLGFLNRICVKPYKVPGTDVTIEKDTPVLISTLGLQRDPDYYPDPLKFDPERFDESGSTVPFSFLPFGEGPRICIGKRYGILQAKLGIVALISQFKFSPSPQTPPFVEFDKLSTSLAMTPSKGVTVKVEKLKF